MANEIYALIRNGVVVELLTISDSTPLNTIVPAGTYVDVTTQSPAVVIGDTAVQNGSGVWVFSSPAALPAGVPRSVSMFQLKMALIAMPNGSATMADSVANWVGGASESIAAMWSNAITVNQGGPFLTAAAAHFGWSVSFVNTLLQAAAAVVDGA